jgi:deoxyhypusine synthase
MLKDKDLRKKIIARIKDIPADKLKEIDQLLDTLIQENEKKMKLLSFAGSWKDMDEKEFTSIMKEIEKRRSESGRQRTDI